MACANQLVTHSVRGCHALGASVRGIARELAEFFDEQLWREQNKSKQRHELASCQNDLFKYNLTLKKIRREMYLHLGEILSDVF